MVANDPSDFAITPDILLPELLRAHPEARTVLDRYGLHGCGGPLGPYESIGFFARAHGIDEARLLHELERAIAAPGAAASGAALAPDAPELADTIYRRYFLGGVLVTLTAGATWGAWLLGTIAVRGSFQEISISSINAHGDAQIFGWVGLFIMGFAYQAFPRLWQAELAVPRLAAWAFAMMVAGLAVRTIGIAATGAWSLTPALALAGGGLQLAAVLIFAGQILATFVRSGLGLEPYIGFVVAALGWFIASSVVSVWHTWNTMTARSVERADLVRGHLSVPAPRPPGPRPGAVHDPRRLAADAAGPLRGAAHARSPRLAALALLVAAVLGEVALFLACAVDGPPRLRRLPAAALGDARDRLRDDRAPLAALAALPGARSQRQVRAGGVCLAGRLAGHALDLTGVSIRVSASRRPAELALQPRLPRRGPPCDYRRLHLADDHGVRGQDRAHAQRHRSPEPLGALGAVPAGQWGLFAPGRDAAPDGLVGQHLPVARHQRDAGGCGPGLVGTRPGVDHRPRVARGRRPAGPGGPRPESIEAHHRVAEVLDWFPETEPVFLERGFTAIRQPLLRRTVARQITLAQAASLRGVPLDELLASLNRAIAARHRPTDPSKFVLPIIEIGVEP